MDSTSPFLQLPRELRDQIYLHYFSSPDNTYVFDFPSKKLRNSDNTPIDTTALGATCKAIASETRGLAFRMNTIKFCTIYSDEHRVLAGQFHRLMRTRFCNMKSYFEELASSMDDSKMEEATNRHPVLIPAIQEFHQVEDRFISYARKWPDVPSRRYFASRDALRSFLSMLPPGEPLPYDDSEPAKPDRKLLEKLLAVEMDPWEIPVDYDLYDLYDDATGSNIEIPTRTFSYYEYLFEAFDSIDNGKYRFSAAAAAIYFLRRTIPEVRSLMRNILIFEDYTSVAFPEGHAIGLIPFCQENPALHIIRRASLWNNIFLYDVDEDDWQRHLYMVFSTNARPPDEGVQDELPMYTITQAVAAWMSEVGILTSLGMPANQYTFFMDGDPMPEQTYKIFNGYVQRAALVQEVLIKASTTRKWPLWEERNSNAIFYEPFPHLVGELSSNRRSGMIQCNFEVGSPRASAAELYTTLKPQYDHADDWEDVLDEYLDFPDDMIVPGFWQTILHGIMSESYCKKHPNGPRKGHQTVGRNWSDNGESDEEETGGEDDDEENDEQESSDNEADAHEADV